MNLGNPELAMSMKTTSVSIDLGGSGFSKLWTNNKYKLEY
jgi:hypothetical protein